MVGAAFSYAPHKSEEHHRTQHYSTFSRIVLFLISTHIYTFSCNQTEKLTSHESKLPSHSIQSGTDHHCLILFIMILQLSIGGLYYPLIKAVKSFPEVWPHSSSVKGNGRSVRIWVWKDQQIYISRFLLQVSLLMLTSLLKAERTGLSLVSGTVLLKLEVIYLGVFDVVCFLWPGLSPQNSFSLDIWLKFKGLSV